MLQIVLPITPKIAEWKSIRKTSIHRSIKNINQSQMGCENSQLVEPAPHQPHRLPPEEEPRQVPAPSKAPARPSTKDLPEKQNSKPREESRKESKKVVGEAEDLSEKKKKVKSEQKLGEVPIVDSTNVPRDNLVIEANKGAFQKRQSKAFSAQKIKRIEEESIGPSSKSISTEKAEEKAEEAIPSQTGVEEFPISNILNEPKEVEAEEQCPPQPEQKKEQVSVEEEKGREEKKSELSSKKQLDDVVRAKKVSSEPEQKQEVRESLKIQLSNFSLDEFEASSIPHTKRLQSEEVEKYLDQLWQFEEEIIGMLLTRMEEKQRQKYEIVPE